MTEISDSLARTALRKTGALFKSLTVQLAIFFILLLSAIWIGVYFQLHHTYEQIIRIAEGDRNHLARAYAEQVKSSVRAIDLTLINLREDWMENRGRFHAAALRRQTYFAHDAIFQVGIINPKGMLIYSSLDEFIKPLSLVDREHFLIHRDRVDDKLFISKPIFGRVAKRWAIQFTRPLRSAGGKFLGVIVISVAPDSFSNFYDTINLDANGTVALINASGAILARSPNPQLAMGKSLTKAPFLDPGAPETGGYRIVTEIDSVERAITWRRIPEFSLTVTIGQAVDGMLAPYELQRRGYLVGGGLTSILLLLFALITFAGLRQRAKGMAALEASEARSHLQVAALEAVGNAVVITNTNGYIEWANPAFEMLTGYTRNEALGLRPVDLLASGLQNNQFYKGMWQSILAGQAWRGELVNRRKDGSLFDEELAIAPVTGRHGEITHFVGIKHDISERKQHEKALQQSHALLTKLSAQIPGMIYQFRMYPDGHSCFPFASQAMFDLYGIAPQQVREDSAAIFALNHPDDVNKFSESILKSARTLEPWHHEFRVALPGKDVRWHQGDARPSRLDDGSTLWHGFISDVTERKEAEAILRTSQDRWKFALEGAGDAVWQWDLQADTIQFTRRLHEILGAPEGRLNGAFDAWLTCIHPDDVPQVMADIDGYIDGKTPAFVTEHRARHEDGSWRWILARGMAVSRAEDGSPLCMIGTQSDITDRKEADAQLRVAAAAFEQEEGMLVTDARGTILRVNHAFTEVTGYSACEAIGQTPALMKSGRQDAAFYEKMWHDINQTGHWKGEIWNRRKNGEIFPEWLVITEVKDAHGIVTHFVGAFSDITMRKESESKIRSLAFYDPLTALPNRRLLMDRVGQALAASARSKRYGALMLLDLDHFKVLNDTLGHDVGDELLIQVALRLTTCVRAGDTVARLGGDEFVVMLEDLSHEESAAATETELVAEKMRSALNLPYLLNGNDASPYQNTPSIGISLFLDHMNPVDVLLKHADIALYQAKDAGRNAIRFYNKAMQAVLYEKAILEAGLREALATDAFRLYYQPQVDQNQVVVGAEALLRWQPPGKSLVSPTHFIPLAEETGLIIQIGQWVLETACTQLAQWAKYPASRDLVLAVNVSARQFRQPDFVARVHSVLAATGANPMRLKLELTESMVINDFEDTVSKMQILREIGVTFALDDFGTGYSSLSYLKRLPLDQVKIDQSFVRDIATDPSDAAIVQTILNMSKTLHLQVVAEGVETIGQHAFLETNSCRFFQGYLFGRPMPVDQFDALLATSRTPPI